MKRASPRFAATAALMTAALVSMAAAGAAPQHSTDQKSRSLLSPSLYGVDIFHDYCSPCHGRDGKGGGPVAVALKPPPADLTQIARKNNGVFPRARVRDFITNGSPDIAAHGTSAMPVWGPTFRALETDERSVSIRIANVVEYLATIQK